MQSLTFPHLQFRGKVGMNTGYQLTTSICLQDLFPIVIKFLKQTMKIPAYDNFPEAGILGKTMFYQQKKQE